MKSSQTVVPQTWGEYLLLWVLDFAPQFLWMNAVLPNTSSKVIRQIQPGHWIESFSLNTINPTPPNLLDIISRFESYAHAPHRLHKMQMHEIMNVPSEKISPNCVGCLMIPAIHHLDAGRILPSWKASYAKGYQSVA